MRRRDRKLDDFTDEIEAHIGLEIERLQEQGVTAEVARAAAHRRFGNLTRAKERFYESGRWLWWDRLHQDIRYGLRSLRKSPGFTVIGVLTIALGIGATTAIFSVVDATLLDPLPYPGPDRLVSIEDDFPGLGSRDVGMSQPEWQDLQRSGIFENVSPAWFDENNLTGSSRPEHVRLLLVAPNYFALLAVAPQVGRGFHPEDQSPGLIPEVVISDGLWNRSFARDPHILDRNVRMDTDLYRIVGVMPAGFDAPGRVTEERGIEIWAATNFHGAPLADHPPRNRRNLPTAIARINRGLTIAEAQRRVDALVASLQKEFPADYPAQNKWSVRLVPLKERVVGGVRPPLTLLFGAVGLVLLIGCVNIANLLLARASARGREMAVRQALGAARARLTRQLLTESLLLSLFGGLAGLAILLSAKRFLLKLVPESLPRLNEVSINWAVLLFALGASLLAGVIFGLAPALHAGRFDLIPVLKEAMRGTTGSGEQARMRRMLVITEFALSLVLMIAAGLLLRSFWDLSNVRLGFDPHNVMSVRTRMPYPNDPKLDKYATASQETPFLRELLRRGATLPGVEEVAIGDSGAIPLDERQRQINVLEVGHLFLQFEGRDAPSEQATAVEWARVTPGYFRLMGIPLLRGRFFGDLDDDKAPQVAVINEAFARTYWPNEDPLGKRFKSARPGSAWVTVVGMIANARMKSLAEADVPQMYLSLYQRPAHHLAIFVRGHLNAAAIPEEMRKQVQTMDPTLPVFGGQMLHGTVAASLSERRFAMEMVALFALTALLLSGLGIYGVISYMVTERTREIGIRLALGATNRDILRVVLRQGLTLAVKGAAVGTIGALIVSNLIAGLLYGVQPTDPLTFTGVAFLLLLVASLATYIPARRALGVDPMTALRYE